MTALAAVDLALRDEVVSRLGSVEDPELPISIVDLGMIGSVALDGGRLVVALVPTFLGCPAQLFIEHDVRQALEGLVSEPVEVVWSSEPWFLERVTPLGRRQLRDVGIAVPRADGTIECPHCGTGGLVADGEWGSTLCRKQAFCNTCRTPVDVMKAPLPVAVTLGRAPTAR